MYVDISRPTFDATKHFAAVKHLQGRVTMEADLNEQAEILLHYLRTAMVDVIGPAGVPRDHAGFKILADKKNNKAVDLFISPGRAYVDGILIENEVGGPADADKATWVKYSTQPDGYLDLAHDDKLPTTGFAVYLRVWERAITALQDGQIREVALGDLAPDTAARSKVIWQVAVMPFDNDPTEQNFAKSITDKLKGNDPRPGLLAAQAKRPADTDSNPCDLPPEAMFRGLANQLYRVEVHSGGPAWSTNQGQGGGDDNGPVLAGATFKFSRENASVEFRIENLKGAVVVLESLGRDRTLGLEIGDWVEITDDAAASRVAYDRALAEEATRAPELRQITAIDYDTRTITLSDDAPEDVGTDAKLHPLVRRWDHRSSSMYGGKRINVADDGALPLIEGQWITLEDGVEVRFASPDDAKAGTYRAGNHWLIPARTITGDVEWPQDANGAALQPAAGVHYHYAPLAWIRATGTEADRRKRFNPLTG